MSSHRLQLVGLGLLLALFAVILWLGQVRRMSPHTPQPTTARTTTLDLATAPSSPDAGTASSMSSQTQPVEQLPLPPCWEGLLALDEHATLSSMQAALQAALAAGDPLLLEYLSQRMAELIGRDPAAALAVAQWAVAAGPPLSTQLMLAIKGSAAVQHGSVADRLTTLGADATQPLDVRRAALDALETQRSLPPERLGRLKQIALDEHSDEAAWVATRTVGRVMTEEFKRSGQAGPYLQELLDIGQHATEAAVRTLALEMPSYADMPMARAALGPLSQVLRQDPDRHVREMAAFRLGLSQDGNQSLAALAAAFADEKDLCVRWAIFRFSVRAAGKDALPQLQRFATLEPRLKADYDDFVAIYASGTADFARVWQEKPERIHCLAEGE